MKIQISDKKKKDVFVSLFQTLKNCSSLISTKINSEFLHIQGMDKSHVCLFDAKINSTWFSLFEINKDLNLSFDSGILFCPNLANSYTLFNTSYGTNSGFISLIIFNNSMPFIFSFSIKNFYFRCCC